MGVGVGVAPNSDQSAFQKGDHGLSENTPGLKQSGSGREKGRNTSHIKNVKSSEPTEMSV